MAKHVSVGEPAWITVGARNVIGAAVLYPHLPPGFHCMQQRMMQISTTGGCPFPGLEWVLQHVTPVDLAVLSCLLATNTSQMMKTAAMALRSAVLPPRLRRSSLFVVASMAAFHMASQSWCGVFWFTLSLADS